MTLRARMNRGQEGYAKRKKRKADNSSFCFQKDLGLRTKRRRRATKLSNRFGTTRISRIKKSPTPCFQSAGHNPGNDLLSHNL